MDIQLVRVYVTQLEALKEYIAALYQHDEDFDSLVNIEAGVNSLMKNEALANAYFIKRGDNKIGYVILTRYHSVEKGGLTLYIDELFVEERFRREGVGKKIMGEIIQIAKEEGAKGLWAQTEPLNDGAQSFFISLGFQEKKTRNFELSL